MTDARTMTESLGGDWFRSYGTAPCPVCQPGGQTGQNALTLADGDNGRLMAHCKKTACSFRDIMAMAGLRGVAYRAPDPATIARREAERRADAQRREGQAERIWQEAQFIEGTIAETYLRHRGINCELPDTLRFHPACFHGPTAQFYPAMVALVEGTSRLAVHRTYLRPDGAGKAGLDGGDKLMLGATAGGAVRLTEGPGRLVVGEGIENGLSLACGLLDGPATMWAGLSTSGLRGLYLPARPGRLTIACDGDSPGRAAAYVLAERAHGLGWHVDICDPGDGADFNDILTGKAVAA